MAGLEWVVLYALLGAFAGFMAGLLGVGGGGIVVPLLSSLLAWQGIGGDKVLHLALGTALTCMIVTSGASLRAHAARGTVEWRVAATMAPGIMAGAFLVSRLAAHLDAAWISLFFALFMALVSARMFSDWQPQPRQSSATRAGMFGVGMGIGSVSALAAVGGGFLTIAYLVYNNIAMKRAIGTSAAIGLPIAIAGTAGYMVSGWSSTATTPYTLGFVYLPAFMAISVASAVAAPYGTRLAQRLPDQWLRRIFAVIALVLSVKMLVMFA